MERALGSRMAPALGNMLSAAGPALESGSRMLSAAGPALVESMLAASKPRAPLVTAPPPEEPEDPRLRPHHEGQLSLELADRSWWKCWVWLSGRTPQRLGLYFAPLADRRARGVLSLDGATVDSRDAVIMVVTKAPRHAYYLHAGDAAAAREWVSAVWAALDRVVGPHWPLQRVRGQERSPGKIPTSFHAIIYASDTAVPRHPPLATRLEHLRVLLTPRGRAVQTEAVLSVEASGDPHLRSVLWQLWLGLLPASGALPDWVAATERQRTRYSTLLERHLSGRPGWWHPLETATALGRRAWDVELERRVWTEVRTTTREVEWFDRRDVRDTLVRICMVWALEHPWPGFREGMCQILTAVAYAVHLDLTEGPSSRALSPDSEEASLRVLLDARFSEHATYALFEALMERWAVALAPAAGAAGDAASSDSAGSRSRSGSASSAPEEPEAPPAVPVDAEHSAFAFAERLEAVHDQLLPRFDPELALHLKRTGLQPLRYLRPWLRVLFCGQFGLRLTLRLWDAIFAATPLDFGLAEQLAAAIVTGCRRRLLPLNDRAAVVGVLRRVRNPEPLPVIIATAIRNLRSLQDEGSAAVCL